MSQEVLSFFGFSCPFGGQFYICNGTTTEFLGCCNSDACANNGFCPEDDLRVAAFNKDRYEDLPREECADSDHLWYTCAFNNPPFMGCCLENPCATGDGCAAKDLGPAFLAPEGPKDENRRTPLLSPPQATKAPTTKEKKPEATTTGSSAGETATGILIAESQGRDSDSGLSTGAIVGIVIGCCAVIVILVAILFYKCGSRKARTRPGLEQPETQYAHAGPYKGDYQAVPSPYSDSSATPGRYSQESYAKAKLSPRSPNFNQAYNDESYEYGQTGHHPAHRRHQGHGYGNGLGVSMLPVPELDSTPVTGELSAEVEALPRELGDTGISSAAGGYGQVEMTRGEDSGRVGTGGAFGHDRTESENNLENWVADGSPGQVMIGDESSVGGSGAAMHDSRERNQPDWQVNRGSGEVKPALRRIPRRPLGSPQLLSPSTTPGPSNLGESF